MSSKGKRGWLEEHMRDEYVQRARAEGYRSRAVYKLLEVQAKGKFIKPGMTVLDLGSAPGGWSQVASKLVTKQGRVIAVDLLDMEPVPGVEFIQGDFTEEEALQAILSAMGENKAAVILSDMAPNLSGMASVDQPKSMYLAELALDLSQQLLQKGGTMLIKLFHGVGFAEFVVEVRKTFKEVTICKPKASRSRSKEVYLLAKRYDM